MAGPRSRRSNQHQQPEVDQKNGARLLRVAASQEMLAKGAMRMWSIDE